MNQIIRLGLLLSGFLLLLLITGCWSSKEIEDLSLYVGLGIDMERETSFERSTNRQGGRYPKENNITATMQIVPRGTAKEQSGEGSPEAGKTYINERETGDSLIQILRQFLLRRDRPLISHHLKVIVISVEVTKKYSLNQLLDFALRDNDIRPSCLVLVSNGEAIEVLSSNESGAIPAFHLIGLAENANNTNKILPKMSLSKLDATMQSGSSYLLQNVISFEGKNTFSGANVYNGKTNRWVGSLSQTDIEGVSWIQGRAHEGIIKMYREKSGSTVSYEIKHNKSEIIPLVKGNDISFHVKVDSDGWLMEDWISPDKEGTEIYLDELEEEFSDLTKQQIQEMLYKMQHKLKVDVGGFGEKLRIKYPKVWKRVKPNWDQMFSGIPITYDVKIKFTNQGSSTE